MIIGDTLPFVTAFINKLDAAVQQSDPTAGLTRIQKSWLGFCVLVHMKLRLARNDETLDRWHSCRPVCRQGCQRSIFKGVHMKLRLTRHDETTRIPCREDVLGVGLEIQSSLHTIHVVS